jgi:hypothetical protein
MTLQEAMLSPRIVVFGHNRLEWLCVETWVFEDQLAMESEITSGRPGGLYRKWIHSPKPREALDNSQRQKHSDCWYSVIKNYSRQNITCVYDKLPALSGLAAMMQKMHPGNYLAELWQEDLLVGLTWYAHICRDVRLPTCLDHYLAPTWSWVSCVNFQIDFCIEPTN